MSFSGNLKIIGCMHGGSSLDTFLAGRFVFCYGFRALFVHFSGDFGVIGLHLKTHEAKIQIGWKMGLLVNKGTRRQT